jgi:hypothetical protein
MKMTIRCHLRAHNSASNHPIGTMLPLPGCVYKESGWATVVEFQKNRSLHYLGHPEEFCVPIPGGIRVEERNGSFGFKRVTEITMGDQP